MAPVITGSLQLMKSAVVGAILKFGGDAFERLAQAQFMAVTGEEFGAALTGHAAEGVANNAVKEETAVGQVMKSVRQDETSPTKTPPTYPFQSLLYNPYSLVNDHPSRPRTPAPAPPVNGLIRTHPHTVNTIPETFSKFLHINPKNPRKPPPNPKNTTPGESPHQKESTTEKRPPPAGRPSITPFSSGLPNVHL